MAKKRVDKTAAEIRALFADKKLIIGTERTLKMLKQGKLKQVLLAKNCAEKTKKDVMRYSKMTDTAVRELNYPSEELGVICKKLYSISVLGVLK
ncbi:ribosomal L7Ae/L30e/S12e/Gadd45 family protein [Candidatus Woesearchaeota archaeon]|nr:ribosomal L7Ae/L30e/S12e/Gadd45 family protein [Candidatus Woesearchaeota archaeon]